MDLQEGIARVLSRHGIGFEREVRLPGRGRIDFVVAGVIGLEVKVRGSLSPVTRQLWRYAEAPELEALVLITTRSLHLDFPDELNGKPFRIIHLNPFT